MAMRHYISLCLGKLAAGAQANFIARSPSQVAKGPKVAVQDPPSLPRKFLRRRLVLEADLVVTKGNFQKEIPIV